MRIRRRKDEPRFSSTASSLIDSGFLVPDYYAAQVETDLSEPAEAAAHYLDVGWRSGHLPNPVHDFDGLALPGPDEVGRSDFVTSTALLPVREYFDIGSYLRLVPQSSEHAGGAAGHFLERVSNASVPFGFDTIVRAPRSWPQLLALARARRRELRDITASGVFDRELYEAQVGFPFASIEAAAWHYIERGEVLGLLPQPGFHHRLSPEPPDPDDNLFARAIRLGQVPPGGDPGSDAARFDVLRQARLVRSAWDLALPSDVPTREASRRFVAAEPARPSDRHVTIVARATRITIPGARHAATLSQQSHQAWTLVIGLDPRASWRTQKRVSRIATRDPRVRVVEVRDDIGTAELLAEQAPDLVAVWDGTEQWDARFLELTIAALNGAPVAITAVAHGTELSNPDPRARHDGAIASLEHLAWSGPRGLRGVVAEKWLFDGGPDPMADVLGGWDLLLHATQQGPIPFVPMIGVCGDRHDAPALEAIAAVRARWTAPARAALVEGVTTVVLPRIDDVEAAALTICSARELELTARLYAGDRGVRAVHPLPAPTTWGHAANQAMAQACGETCLFVEPGTLLPIGAVETLTAELHSGVAAVSAILVAADSTIAAGVLAFPGRHTLPHRMLWGHPVEDLPDLTDVDLAAAEAPGLVIRTELAQQLGLDPALDELWAMPDLTLRMTDAGHAVRTLGTVRIIRPDRLQAPLDGAAAPPRLRRLGAIPEEHVLLQAVGLQSVGTSTGPDGTGTPMLIRPPRTVTAGLARGLPSLRWAIKAPMQPGLRGDSWGDTFFIADLASALRRLGQEVVIDRRASHHRPASAHLDDVVLNVRGLVPYIPQPGTTSLVWVISHPERIGAEQIDSSVDLVYAASVTWAEQATRTFGRPVRPLLQATDPTRFHPDVPAEPHGIVFVGRPKYGGLRPIIRDVVETGMPFEVYGEGWTGLIDEAYLRGDFMPNDRLPRVYRGARVVLNDHHVDMAEHGFWSNRAFDATATGAVVVSDGVAGGSPELFRGLVRSYSSVDELAELLSPDAPWPDEDERRKIAGAIGRDHSFDARARRMLADVLDVRGITHELAPPS
jgi:hypothetical protein